MHTARACGGQMACLAIRTYQWVYDEYFLLEMFGVLTGFLNIQYLQKC